MPDSAWEELIGDIESWVAPEPEPEEDLPVFQYPLTPAEALPFMPELDINLKFGPDKTYYDFQVSNKHTVRIFPEFFRDFATTGCKIINEGIINDDLKWAVVSVINY